MNEPSSTPRAAGGPTQPRENATSAAPGPGERSPDELREDLDELRTELGSTVEELAHRADVPTRLRAKRDEAAQRVQEQAAHAREVVAQKAPAVQETVQGTVRERPGLVGGGAVALALLLISLRRRRRRRRHDVAA